MLNKNKLSINYQILLTHHECEDITGAILEYCDADNEKFNEIYNNAVSRFGNYADYFTHAIINDLCEEPGKYYHTSNALLELKVAIDMAHWLHETKKTKINPNASDLQYIVNVKDTTPSDSKIRHGTDIDVCFPGTCVEVCGTTNSVLSEQSLLTENLHQSKWDVLKYPNQIIKSQRGKFKDIHSAYFVVPKQITFNPNHIKDLDDLHTQHNAIAQLKKVKTELNNNGITFEILKTENVWNGIKPMPTNIDITYESINKFMERKNKKTKRMTLKKAIILLSGNPKEIFNFN